MPIYEFYSPDSNTTYSFLAKSMAFGEKTPRCPDDPSFVMQRKVSGFAFIGRAKDSVEDDAMGELDDAKMEKVMAELERDMAGLDQENPDPRQMAQLMRKMSAMTGEELPGEMEEMIARLEAGEDPEALEEELGDSFDEMDDLGGEGGGELTPGEKMRLLRKRLRSPRKDPALYDMAEYCD